MSREPGKCWGVVVRPHLFGLCVVWIVFALLFFLMLCVELEAELIPSDLDDIENALDTSNVYLSSINTRADYIRSWTEATAGYSQEIRDALVDDSGFEWGEAIVQEIENLAVDVRGKGQLTVDAVEDVSEGVGELVNLQSDDGTGYSVFKYVSPFGASFASVFKDYWHGESVFVDGGGDSVFRAADLGHASWLELIYTSLNNREEDPDEPYLGTLVAIAGSAADVLSTYVPSIASDVAAIKGTAASQLEEAIKLYALQEAWFLAWQTAGTGDFTSTNPEAPPVSRELPTGTLDQDLSGIGPRQDVMSDWTPTVTLDGVVSLLGNSIDFFDGQTVTADIHTKPSPGWTVLGANFGTVFDTVRILTRTALGIWFVWLFLQRVRRTVAGYAGE